MLASGESSIGLSRYTLYMQDYGVRRVEALIVQNAVAHNEGLGAIWKPRRAFWADRAANEAAFRATFLSLATTRARHLGDDPNTELYDPDLWTDEFAYLSAPGQADIQTELFYDYRANVDAYPKWQASMRERKPRLLVVWGASMTRRSTSASRNAIAATFLTPRFTFSTPAISRSTPRPTRSRRWSGTSCRGRSGERASLLRSA